MMKFTKPIIRTVANFIFMLVCNRTSQIFVTFHWILFAVAIYQRGRGFSIHGGIETTQSEPILFSIIFLLNIPALLLAIVIILPIGLVVMSLPASVSSVINNLITEELMYLLFSVCITFQWALIGYGFGKLFGRKSGMK